MRPPQVLTVYYAGLDTNVHNNPNYPAVGATHLTTTDRYLGTLARLLEQWNLMDEAMFTFTGDHGLTDVVEDDTHSLLFYQYTNPDIPELYEPFQALGYDLLRSVIQIDFDSVLTVNGGMAHVYVRNRDSGWWPDKPRYSEDVLPLAQGIYAWGVNDNSTAQAESIELVLVRDSNGPDGWREPYRVLFRALRTTGSFLTLPLDAAIDFTLPVNGLPLIPSSYVDILDNIQRLQDIRSGDIILISNYSKRHRNAIAPYPEGDIEHRDGGYYFGGQLPCWHGSLYDTDMTIPIIFSCPHGDGVAFKQAVNALLPAQARITDIGNSVHNLLTGE